MEEQRREHGEESEDGNIRTDGVQGWMNAAGQQAGSETKQTVQWDVNTKTLTAICNNY